MQILENVEIVQVNHEPNFATTHLQAQLARGNVHCAVWLR